MSGQYTRGVVFVHSAPRALCSHVEWAIGTVLNARVSVDWTAQPAVAGMLRAEHSWVGPAGTGARLASALRGWTHLRYEITEEASPGSDGARWSHTPELGIFHAVTDAHGNILIPADRVSSALASNDAAVMMADLELALGRSWDEELEPFRYAGAGAPVKWLHRVG